MVHRPGARQLVRGQPEIEIDGDEIQVVGTLRPPQLPEGTSEDEVRVAERARISGFREESRGARMRIADEAQPAFRRTVSWGAVCGGSKVLFTTAGVPVMTRLRMADRRVLDTLIDGGVARSRSEALAWCVRLVAEHEADWIRELRDAMTAVEDVRNRGQERRRRRRLVVEGHPSGRRSWATPLAGRHHASRRASMHHGTRTVSPAARETSARPYRALGEAIPEVMSAYSALTTRPSPTEPLTARRRN